MTELLAPAGSFTALKAALANGANAVYLGGKTFSARAYADNFTLEEITEAVKLAHFWHTKVYVALNTLVSDEEMVSAVFYTAELYRAGVDAIIIQDLGLLELLRQALPELDLHASTQMGVHNAAGCNLLASLGVKRVILSRELSLADMQAVRVATKIGLETFVHGALCICFSGQCLFSSLVGSRSGNRGRCAQPCRLAYRLVNDYGEPVDVQHPGLYLLSPRDLFGYEKLEQLHALNLDAWKIEGRMKKPEYVAVVTGVYSRALQELGQSGKLKKDQEALRRLLQVFNRDHNCGYWEGNPGASLMSYARPNNRGVLAGRIVGRSGDQIKVKLSQPLFLGDMLELWVSTGSRETLTVSEIGGKAGPVESAAPGETVLLAASAGREGDRVFKIFDAPLINEARQSYTEFPVKPLHFTIQARLGQPLWLRAQDDDGYAAEQKSDYVVEAAVNSVSDMTSVKVQLGRLGGSGYGLGEVEGELDQNVMLPSSVLNKARRALVDELLYQRQSREQRPFDQIRFAQSVKNNTLPTRRALPSRMQLSVLAADREQALLAASRGVHDIYLDAVGFAGREKLDYPLIAKEVERQGSRLIPYLPQIILPQEEAAWRELIISWHNNSIEAVVINNIGQLALMRELGWDRALYAGMGINCFNSYACRLLQEQGVSRVILSPELTDEQLRELRPGALETEVFAQGALQLMVSEYCAAGALRGGRDLADGKDQACSRPCLQDGTKLHLRDEKGFIFPLRFDSACRMHVFNSREHCLFKEIPALQQAGVGRLLLDLRLYNRQRAGRLLDLYLLAVKDRISFEEARDKINTLMRDYTKGHLHRGV
jgi:U32 family peptidase